MSRPLLLAFGSAIFAACTATFSLHAQDRALRDPDWTDPGVARAHDKFQKQRRRGTARSAPLGGRELSLPRWGFADNLKRTDPSQRSLARTPEKLTSRLRWPDCAAAKPQTDQVRDETGVWYTDNYDFGCIILSVSGDRAYNPSLKVPDSAPRVSACESDAGSSTQHPPGGDREGRFDLQLLLNRIPYTISGQCFEGALEFCRDRTAQCALVDRLIYLEGSKE